MFQLGIPVDFVMLTRLQKGRTYTLRLDKIYLLTLVMSEPLAGRMIISCISDRRPSFDLIGHPRRVSGLPIINSILFGSYLLFADHRKTTEESLLLR